MKSWKFCLSATVLLCAVSSGWGESVFDSFEDGKLEGFPSWQVERLRASCPDATIERIAGEHWLHLRCDFGGSLTQGTAVGVLAEDLEAREFDITVRVRLQEGFLASVNLRCDPERLSGYAGGISREDRLYVVRMHEGRTRILGRAELPEQREGIHEDCWIRFKTERHRLFLKAWSYGEDEPERWQIETEDRRLAAGLAGLAVSCYSPFVGGQPTAEARFDQVRIALPGQQLIASANEPRALGR